MKSLMHRRPMPVEEPETDPLDSPPDETEMEPPYENDSTDPVVPEQDQNEPEEYLRPHDGNAWRMLA